MSWELWRNLHCFALGKHVIIELRNRRMAIPCIYAIRHSIEGYWNRLVVFMDLLDFKCEIIVSDKLALNQSRISSLAMN